MFVGYVRHNNIVMLQDAIVIAVIHCKK